MYRPLFLASAVVFASLTGFAHAQDAPAMSWQKGLSRTDLVRQDLGADNREVIQARIEKRDDLDGRQSVYAALAWTKGRFSFSAMEVDMEDDIKSTTTGLLMEGARLMDEDNR